MLRFRIQELLAERQFQTGDRVTLTALAAATGINRVTLSKLINHRGYSTVTENLDRLCKFFSCPVERLIEYVPDADVLAEHHPRAAASPSPSRDSRKSNGHKKVGAGRRTP
jgi:putative transcriptional regulator